jgi:hypothetical protein
MGRFSRTGEHSGKGALGGSGKVGIKKTPREGVQEDARAIDDMRRNMDGAPTRGSRTAPPTQAYRDGWERIFGGSR